MKRFQQHVALAFDGGGVRGLVPAVALGALEEKLGRAGQRQILSHYNNLRVLAGTSTGALLAAAIACGMTSRELVELYRTLPSVIFEGYGNPLQYRKLIRGALYDRDVLEAHVEKVTNNRTLYDIHYELNPDQMRFGPNDIDKAKAYRKKVLRSDAPEFAEEKQRITEEKSLLLTAYYINERRTCFIKSNDPGDWDWTLSEAVLASASAPLFFKPLERIDRDAGQTADRRYYCDGGVGNYNNPAYIAARELIDWRCLPQGDCTVVSFGVGYSAGASIATKRPTQWGAVGWLGNLLDFISSDAIRSQSFIIMNNYMESAAGLDFRRYQVSIKEPIRLDCNDPDVLELLEAKGHEMKVRIEDDQFAPNEDRDIDPEQLKEFYVSKVQASQKRGA